jgi:hypothetical protein
MGLVSQADIDKVTTVENKHYPEEAYAKFSAAVKAKHWQLRNPGKERGTGGKKSGISATNISDFASAISSARQRDHTSCARYSACASSHRRHQAG